MNADMKRNIFNRYISSRNLTATELKIIMLLESYTNWHNGLSTSPLWDGHIEEITGLRRDKIRKARQSLINGKILTASSEGLPAANYIYVFNFDEIPENQGTQSGSERNPIWAQKEPSFGLKGTYFGFPPSSENIITDSGWEPDLGLKGTQSRPKRNPVWVQKEPDLGTLSTVLSSSSTLVLTTTNLTYSMRACLLLGMIALGDARKDAEKCLRENQVFENLAKEKISKFSPWTLLKYCRWLPWMCRDIENTGKKVGSRGALLSKAIDGQWEKPFSLREHEKAEFIRTQKKTEKDWEEERKKREHDLLKRHWEELPDGEKFRIFDWISGRNHIYGEALKEIPPTEPLDNLDGFHRGIILGCFQEWDSG